jgi:hypothetical protein
MSPSSQGQASVPIYGVTKTIVDLFRYRRVVGTPVVIKAMRETLRQRKATPAEMAPARRAGTRVESHGALPDDVGFI